jgi:lipoprotein-anchoring transpeptidase ErfK/SrfK
MRRICVSALVASALYSAGSYGPVFAQANGPPVGSGGFIEMIFAGSAREPTVPRPYQPDPQYPAYPPGYMPPLPSTPRYQAESALQASYTMGQPAQLRYQAAPAPQVVYQAAPAPQVQYQTVAPQQASYAVARAPAPEPNYKAIPMPQVAYEALPPVQVDRQPAPARQVSYQPTSAPHAARQPAPAPEPDYVGIIPMPQVGYEPLPPVQQQAHTDPAPAFAPSSQGDMAHQQIDPKYDRQVVDYKSPETPGTIIIDTPHHFLFLVQDHGKALRYGIGVGRPGFTWEGIKTITAKKEWPDWYPPSDMLQRRPDLPRYMAGGPENPLGARAMYLGSTLYRIHGSNEPWTIGSDVSSGCIRLRNADVIDLYNRVQVGAKVVVM